MNSKYVKLRILELYNLGMKPAEILHSLDAEGRQVNKIFIDNFFRNGGLGY